MHYLSICSILKSRFFKKDHKIIEILHVLKDFSTKPISNQSRFFYGYKEVEKLTEGIFTQTEELKNGEKIQLYSFFNHSKYLENFVQRELLKFRENNLIVFENNSKRINFVSEMFTFFINNGYYEFTSKVSTFFPFLGLNRYKTSFKLIVTNLLILAHKFCVIEEQILRYVLEIIVNIDCEFTIKNKSQGNSLEKYKSDVDFLMRMTMAYMKLKDKGIEKFNRKSKDVYTDYYIEFVKKNSNLNAKVTNKNNFEKFVLNIIDIFFEKIVKIESPNFVQYLIPFICQLKSKPQLKTEFNSFSDCFFKNLFQKMMSKNVQTCIKEKLLVYLYSYIRFAKVDSSFIYNVVYYLDQFLFLVTKKITKKINEQIPGEIFEKGELIEESSESIFVNAFDNNLYVKLLHYITCILNESLEIISTNAKIDIINFFECYFSRFYVYIYHAVKHNENAKEILIRLNNFLRISKLFGLNSNEYCESSFSLASSPCPKRQYLSSTYCSISSMSIYNIKSDATDSDKRPSSDNNSFWKFSKQDLPFEDNIFSFFKEFAVKHSKVSFSRKIEKESFDDFEDSLVLSINLSKKNSFSETESIDFAQTKRVKLN